MIEALSTLAFLLAFIAVRNNWGKNKAIVYLAIFISMYSLFVLTHKVVVYSTNPTLVAIFYAHFSPLFYLPGPFLYFYFRSITRDKWVLNKKDVWHLLPLIITLVGLIPYYFRPWDQKIQIAHSIISDFDYYKDLNVNVIIPSLVNTFLRPFLLIGYLAASVYVVAKKHLSIKSDEDPKILSHYLVTKNWSYFIMLVGTLSVISYFIVISVFYEQGIDEAKASAYKWQSLSAALFALIPASMLLYPQLVYGFVSLELVKGTVEQKTSRDTKISGGSAVTDSSKQSESIDGAQVGAQIDSDLVITDLPSSRSAKETSGIGLDNNLSQLKDAIESYFDEKSPYLNPQFKVADVASYLGVPPHHINFCFSIAFDENFAQYKTRYRINHALKLLEENANERYSIEAIGNLSGFASKSNFFKAFRQATGTTPQEYVQALKTGGITVQ